MKKWIALTAAFSLAVSALAQPIAAAVANETPAAEKAGSYSAEGTVSEPTTEDMERLLKTVKPKLPIPEDCVNFTWNYNAPSYYRTASWSFVWSNSDYTVTARVSCDDAGNITGYSLYRRDTLRGACRLPQFTKAQLAETAAASLAALCPQAAPHMRLTSSRSGGLYAHNFLYTFTRYENDVIVPEQTAVVTVDYLTGELSALSCNYNVNVPFAQESVLTAEQAKERLAAEQTMQLSYRLKNEYDDNGNLTERKAYLVYTPTKSYLAIDAVTGDIYTERNTWSVVSSDNGASGGDGSFLFAENAMKDEAAEAEEYKLSEQELAQLEVLSNLITKQQAVDAVLKNEKLAIDPSANAVVATLIREDDAYAPHPLTAGADEHEPTYVWRISFSAPYNENAAQYDYYEPYMYARVDAATGTILSFNASVPDYSYYVNDQRSETPPTPVYSAEQARDIFRAFAESQIPEKMALTRLSSEDDRVVIDYQKNGTELLYDRPVYRCTRVNFVRVNEGVDFSYNDVRGEVDRVTGKVTSFGYSWFDDVEFESPDDAITPETAYRVLLDSDGFGLNYEINSNYTYNQYLAEKAQGYVDLNTLYETEQYTRLVYSGYAYGCTTVAALSGELVTYAGTPYAAPTSGYRYDDIDGHWAESEIRMLADLDIGFDGGSFLPDSAITVNEFVQLMNQLGAYSDMADSADGSDGSSDAPISRTQAVKYLIDAAGYAKIAAMPDIFITDFADNSELLREDVGFIAIARGMGLVQGDALLFRPYDSLTRAEAVTCLVNFVKLSE